jgi:sterol desaturase/sphingolipid hydroxylase (fatty acid hydroxylase superfamily)
MEQIAFWKAMTAIVVIVSLMIAERLYPVASRPAGGGRVFKNFGLAAGNAVLSPLLIVPLTAAAAAIAPSWRPAALDGGLAILLDLLLLDLWIYVWHRASHENRFLWRFHEVHHLDEFLDVSSAVRFHFGEVILSAIARASFVFLLDVALISVLIFDAMVLLAAVFHHSNVKLPKRFEAGLRTVIVTPSHHWVHHHRVRADTDSNYGTVLTIWDRLFGSWSPHDRSADMPIGTQGRKERSFAGLLKRPLDAP